MLVVQGYILKYGDTICGHPPVVKGAMMRNPNDGKIYATRSNIPVYITDKYFSNQSEHHPDAYACVFPREYGIYANIYFELNHMHVHIETMKTMRLGCYATNIVKNKGGEVVDGYLIYIQMGAEGNVEPIDKMVIEMPGRDPDIIFERKDENEN